MSGQAVPGFAMGVAPRMGFSDTPFGKLTGQMGTNIKKINSPDIRTPGWQMLWKIIVFLLLILVFGGIYQAMIGNNPEEWSHPTNENYEPIINGFYVSTIINSTVGYGDYYPYSERGVILVVFNILISWIVFSLFLG